MAHVPFQAIGVEGGICVLLHGISLSRTIRIRILVICRSAGPSTWNAVDFLWVNCWPWWWRWLTTPSFQCNNTKTSLRIWYQTYRACTHPLGSLLISSPYSQPLLPSITQWYGICPRTCYWTWSHIRCRGTPISLKYFLIACEILIPIFPSIGNTKMCPNSVAKIWHDVYPLFLLFIPLGL